MMRRGWMLVPLALVVGACQTSSKPQPPGDGPAEEPARAPLADVRVQRTHIGQPELRQVSWPAENVVDRDTLGLLSEDARAAVRSSKLPVLAPRRATLAAPAKVVARPNFTALAIRGQGDDDGLTVSLSATRVSQRYELAPTDLGAARPHQVRNGKPAWVLQNEGIWSVTWEEHGVSYVLELECATAGADLRCQSEREVLRLAEELAFVGGSFETAGGTR